MKRFAAWLLILLFASTAFAQDPDPDPVPHPPTHKELKSALGSQELKDRTEVAIRIAIDKVIKGEDSLPDFAPANHANRLIWALRIMNDPAGPTEEAAKFFTLVIVSNRATDILVPADLLDITDADLQSAVDQTFDFFADGN